MGRNVHFLIALIEPFYFGDNGHILGLCDFRNYFAESYLVDGPDNAKTHLLGMIFGMNKPKTIR